MVTQNFSISPAAVTVQVLSILTLVLDIPSFVWHIKNRNLSASVLVFWIILVNFFDLVNALLWPTDDVGNWWHGQIWCDIQVKLVNASNVAILGAIASTMRALAIALDTDRIVLSASTAQRRRNWIIDGLLCFGLPLYMIVIHYVVQPTRYYIFAIAGCTPSFDNSWPSIVIIYIWPPIICLLDAFYGGLVIVRLRKYRKNFSAILTASNSGLTKSRFIRLFSMAFILILLCLPVQLYVFYINVMYPLQPYSWDAIHGPEWWDIILVPTNGAVEIDRWIRIASGFVVFFGFGFGRDAKAMYRSWLLKIGLGRIFPRLHNDRLPSYSQTASSTSHPSFSSKARKFFTQKLRYDRSTATFSSTNPSVITTLPTPSSSDPEKSLTHQNNISEPSAAIHTSTHIEKPPAHEPTPSVSSRRGIRSWFNLPTARIFSRKPTVHFTMQAPHPQIPSCDVIATHDWSTSPAPLSTLSASREQQRPSDLDITRGGRPPTYREGSVLTG
ncbi:a-factor receptor [Varicellaria rhodocarpa]|nr:a-factor receptor [Varicellaria rhodocarpa]